MKFPEELQKKNLKQYKFEGHPYYDIYLYSDSNWFVQHYHNLIEKLSYKFRYDEIKVIVDMDKLNSIIIKNLIENYYEPNLIFKMQHFLEKENFFKNSFKNSSKNSSKNTLENLYNFYGFLLENYQPVSENEKKNLKKFLESLIYLSIFVENNGNVEFDKIYKSAIFYEKLNQNIEKNDIFNKAWNKTIK
ncbi:MAG: hypothetical protein WC337_01930 [Candidatus Muiribacteriota bacterium]